MPSRAGRDGGRDAELYRRWAVYGWTQAKIAEHFGLSLDGVNDGIRRYREGLDPADKREMIDASIELLKEVNARALEIADMAGAPVAVGKDGTVLVDPDTGLVVRDYSLRLRALETAMKASNDMAKRLGLDAASKVESTATVRYELAGVDPEDLS